VNVALGVAGFTVTLLAVCLAAWLSAKAVARACMRLEHRQMLQRIDILEAFKDGHGQWSDAESHDLERRLDRLEAHLGMWGPAPKKP